MVNLDDFSLWILPGSNLLNFLSERRQVWHFYTYITTADISWITGRFFFFFFLHLIHTVQLGAPAMLGSEIFSLFCASIYVIISFILVSNIITPITISIPCLHGKLKPVHRHFQKHLSKVSKILELDLKCQVHSLKNPHGRQNIMLYNVYKSVCH